MADVRALLRQQRSARRIDHPHAVYSESGKLSCAVCREPVRLESAWDDHVRSQLHRTSVTKLRTQPPAQAQPVNALGLSDNTGNGNGNSNAHKRRRSDAMEDDGDVEMGSDGDDERGKKRTRSETAAAANTSKPQIQIQVPDTEANQSKTTSANTNGDTKKTSAQLTPPLGRRSSGTPVHGVEMRIPSRPATPIASKDTFMGGTAASTPKLGHLGRSPLIPQSDGATSKPTASVSAVASAAAALSAATSFAAPATAAPAEVNEDEWAAFEAEVVNAPAVAAAKPDFTGAAVIAGAAVSADGTLADRGAETTRREAEEAQLVDEREEATRALEDEFEDMHELESRVRKLKEKREALRSQPAGSNTPAAASTIAPAPSEDVRRPSAAMIDKENIRQQLAAAQKGSTSGKGEPAIAEEEEDDDDDDDDADWDVFRFKA